MPRMSRALWTSLLSLAGALPAPGQSVVSGTVRDSANQPIGNALISIDALGRNTTTDSTGRYALTNLSAGLRLVQVRRVGFASTSRMVGLRDGATATADFVLAKIVVKLDTVRVVEQYKPTDILMMEFLE